ncbi:hypothetical protein HJC23_004917 [Cyclotella cryptica]|uniref:Uncharacterized protein n=1 Tax=Cyclotella cryptica TaxID=29204 RepID=A0ABD3PXR1_9STRA
MLSNVDETTAFGGFNRNSFQVEMIEDWNDDGSSDSEENSIDNISSSEHQINPNNVHESNSPKESIAIRQMRHDVFAKLPAMKQFAAMQPSPACRPNLDAALPEWKWSNSTRFTRMYFYHARKAGGTSLARYFSNVARHYGLKFKAVEWKASEEPGEPFGETTFYVTHLREPVDRAISHFKYQGRWNCRDLGKWFNSKRSDFVPTNLNANKIETWVETGGFDDTTCPRNEFSLGECAVNCYTQWISGLSCPQYNISTEVQYEVANARLRRYNFIVILERLADERYASAIEQFFGVPGVTNRRSAFCERSSRKANKMNPLVVTNETRQILERLNEVDLRLYNEISDCGVEEYEFGRLDPARLVSNSVSSSDQSSNGGRNNKN